MSIGVIGQARRAGLLGIGIVLVSVVGCGPAPTAPTVVETPATPAVSFDPAAPPAKLISEYHLFRDAKKQIPNEGVVPFDVITPLFSDYAHKRRFVYVPRSQSAAYREHDAFDFPTGSVLVKTFSYPHDFRDPSKGERIIETRLLVKKASGWVGLPYIWNEDMSDAKLAVAGGRTEVKWTHDDGSERSINYLVPNMNICKQCHENSGVMLPLGPKARHLNHDFAYEDGPENQLRHWAKAGVLTGGPTDAEAAPRVAKWDDPTSGSVEARARAYLDINCAHCHNPKGPAYTTGLDLSYGQEELVRFGVYKTPVATGRGSGGRKFGIHPGEPDDSIMLLRMQSAEIGVLMPTVGRLTVHEEAVDLMEEWIAGMEEGG